MAIGELAAASHERIPLDLEGAGLPVDLGAVDEDLGVPFVDELPADDWAAQPGD